MRKPRKQRKQQPLIDEEVTVTTIPESCLPGGEDAEAYQNAFADLLEARSDDDKAAAMARLRELGMEDITGRIVTA